MPTSFRNFLWTENISKTELFENDGLTITMYCDFPGRTFLKHKSKMNGDVIAVFSDFSTDAFLG